MRKLLVFFICIGCALSVSFIDVSATSDDFFYSIKNGEVTIESYYGTDTNIVIPEEIEGLPVTKINDFFEAYELEVIESITISKNINQIQGIYINDHDDVIEAPFCNVYVYEYIVDEDNETFASYNGSIYSKDFKTLYRCPQNQEVSDLHIGVETILPGAYMYTDYISIALPKTVKEMPTVEGYFSILGDMNNLQEIIVEPGNTNFYVENDALYQNQGEEKVLLKYPSFKLTENYQIADGTTRIEWNAFQGNNVKKVEFPSSLTRIDEDSFKYCDSLEVLNLPNTITSIGNAAFYYCSSLEKVTMTNSVVEIGYSAFSQCQNLKYVKLSNNIDNLPGSLFSDDKSLENITIPEGITTVDLSAFWGCDNLKTITMPQSVTNIISSSNVSYAFIVHENSYAHNYALENDINYKIIGDTLLGDINNDQIIDYNDAVIALQSDSGIINLDDNQKLAADVNKDDLVDYNDAVQILKYDAGLISEF